MSAPMRWKDPRSQSSDELRAVLRHAATRAPSEAQLMSLTAAVTKQLGAVTPTVAVKGALSSGALKIAVVGLAAALGGAWIARQHVPTRPMAQPAEQVEVVRHPPPSAAPVPQPVIAPPVVQEPVAVQPRPAVRAKVRRHSVPTSAPRPSDVAPLAELPLLHAARAARDASPSRALALLAEHARRFPNSAFTEEREALRISMLALTDCASARHRLRELSARFPTSAYRHKLEAAVRACIKAPE